MLQAVILFLFGISTSISLASDPWDDGPYTAKHKYTALDIGFNLVEHNFVAYTGEHLTVALIIRYL